MSVLEAYNLAGAEGERLVRSAKSAVTEVNKLTIGLDGRVLGREKYVPLCGPPRLPSSVRTGRG